MGERAKRGKGDRERGALVRRLPAETTGSWKWIAVEWHLGRWTHVSKLLGQKNAKSVNGDTGTLLPSLLLNRCPCPKWRWPHLIRHGPPLGYSFRMSYLTLEIEIDHGKVVPKEPARLPQTGTGLLTIFQPEDQGQPALTPLQALDALQKHLRLDAPKTAAWMNLVREARR